MLVFFDHTILARITDVSCGKMASHVVGDGRWELESGRASLELAGEHVCSLGTGIADDTGCVGIVE